MRSALFLSFLLTLAITSNVFYVLDFFSPVLLPMGYEQEARELGLSGNSTSPVSQPSKKKEIWSLKIHLYVQGKDSREMGSWVIYWLLQLEESKSNRINDVCALSSVQFSHSVTSNSLWPRGPQHTKPPRPSPIPELCALDSHNEGRYWNGSPRCFQARKTYWRF